MPRTQYLLASVVVLLLAVACTPDLESKFRSGPNVTVGADEMVDDDVYLAGGMVNVLGRVQGDVIAAGGEINISGEVTENVIAAGGRITINAPLEDDLRVAGGDIRILFDVADDVIAAGGSVVLAPEATVGGDFVVGAGRTHINGTVEGDLLAGSGVVVIGGTVRGSAVLEAERVVMGPGAVIEGDLAYTSPHVVEMAPGAQVLGTTTREVPTIRILGIQVESTPATRAVAEVMSQVQWLLGTFIVGLLLLWLVPVAFQSARGTLESSPWATLGMGVLALLVVPLAAIILGIIAVVIGGIAGAPVGLVPMALYAVLLALATPVVAVVIGRLVLTRVPGGEPRAWLALLLGVVILALVGLVPVLSWIVGVLTILLGLGAWVLLGWRGYFDARRAQRV